MEKKTKDGINECIREGLNFKQTKEKLEKEGITKDFHSSFYKMKQEIFPENLRGETLGAMKEVKENKKQPLLPTPKAWSKQRQKEADECVFADAINEALFYFIPCPQNGLKIEDVKQINLGGGIVSVVSYYTNINLNHPVIVLVTRAIVLVLKIRNMCYVIHEKYSELKQKAKGELPGQGNIGSMQ